MIEQNLQHDHFLLLQEINSSPLLTQRTISSKLGISLGKTNQLISQFIKKGLIGAKSLNEIPAGKKKMRYVLTAKGKKEFKYLLHVLLKVKENEYARLRQEWRKIKKEQKDDKGVYELAAKWDKLLPHIYTVMSAKAELIKQS